MSDPRELIGAPFTPGGDSPAEGFDCYGLLRYVRARYYGLATPVAGGELLERASLAASTRTVAATRAGGAWRQVAPPGAPGDCVLLGRRRASSPSHMGVVLEPGVLHAFRGESGTGGSVILTSWRRLVLVFGTVEVWACPRNSS